MSIQSLNERMQHTTALDSLLTREEFMAMLQAAECALDRAILCLGLIGLRASEIAAFRSSWVDLSRQTVTVPPKSAKMGKGRVVPFGRLRVVADILCSFVVCEKGVCRSRVAVWGRVTRMASRAKIGHPVTTHGLRATGATWMATAGFSITGLQAHFGWSNLKTAEHYIRASGASAMADMERCGSAVI